jgi:predicted lipid-binding transport protein (Tim44 family)
MTPAEMKVQKIGFTLVGIILAIAGVIILFFLKDMADNALMGASPKFKPNFPAVPVTDITQAPQCAAGYDKTWVGCQKLGE